MSTLGHPSRHPLPPKTDLVVFSRELASAMMMDMSAIVVTEKSAVLSRLVTQAEETFQAATAHSTRVAYEGDWKRFTVWCEEHGLASLPADPTTVILYATDMTKNEGKALNTLYRRMAAISQCHKQAGYQSPTQSYGVAKYLAGLRRELTVAQTRKRPILAADLREIVTGIPDTTIGIRDRALLLLGFAGAFRRSELAALDLTDVELVRDGMIVTIRKSKTDQEGEGRNVGIPFGRANACPVTALQAWIQHAGIENGALFLRVDRHSNILPQRLCAQAVALIVKKYAEQLGYDPDAFGGHSLRAGLATSAAQAGKSERAIMAQTGHKSVATVRRYIREGSLFRENAAEGVL